MGKGSGGCARPSLAIGAVAVAEEWSEEGYENPLSIHAGPTTLETTTLPDDHPAVIDFARYPQQHNSNKLNYELVTTPEGLAEVVSALEHPDVERVALDIETTGRFVPWEGSIRLIQLAVEEPEPRQFIIDVWACDPAPVLPFLASAEREIVMCGGRYEQLHLLYRYGLEIGRPYDVTYASHVITKPRNRSISGSFRALMLRYVNKRISKEQQNSGWDQSNLSIEQLRYAAMDVAGLLDIRRRIGLDVAQRGLAAAAQGKFYGILSTSKKSIAQNARQRSDQASRLVRAIRLAHTREEADRYRALVPRLPLTLEQVDVVDAEYAERVLSL